MVVCTVLQGAYRQFIDSDGRVRQAGPNPEQRATIWFTFSFSGYIKTDPPVGLAMSFSQGEDQELMRDSLPLVENPSRSSAGRLGQGPDARPAAGGADGGARAQPAPSSLKQTD